MKLSKVMRRIHGGYGHDTRIDNKIFIDIVNECYTCGKFIYYFNAHKRKWLNNN